MEIIIALAVLGFGLWWFFLRTPATTQTSAPYKVETPPTPETTEVSTPAPAVEAVVVVDNAVAPTAVVETPAKKPRKPRAPKVVAETVAKKPAAKKAAPVKKAAAIKTAPKKPTTPKSKKA